jgi:hypothetical protein
MSNSIYQIKCGKSDSLLGILIPFKRHEDNPVKDHPTNLIIAHLYLKKYGPFLVAVFTGIGGRIKSESVAGLEWNAHLASASKITFINFDLTIKKNNQVFLARTQKQ